MFKEGGNETQQAAIYDHLHACKDSLFFAQVAFTVERMVKWHGTAKLESQQSHQSAAVERGSSDASSSIAERDIADGRLLLKVNDPTLLTVVFFISALI